MFSVIIPLYNKEKYISQAINSVLEQTYTHFEIVVVDDGSTDNSAAIVRQFSDPRIRIIQKMNEGVSIARNRGVAESKYEYIAFIDADDLWMPTFLEEIEKLIREYPDAAIYGTNNYYEFGTGKISFEKYESLFKGSQTGIISDYFNVFANYGKSPFTTSNFCNSRKVFQEIGGYTPGVKLTEDSDLWCRIALNYPIAYSKLPLATYKLGTTGSTHLLFEPDDFQVTKTLQKALLNHEVKQEHISSVKKLIAFQKLSLIKRALLVGQKKFALSRLMNIRLFFYYPTTTIFCWIIVLIPHRIVVFLRKRFYSI